MMRAMKCRKRVILPDGRNPSPSVDAIVFLLSTCAKVDMLQSISTWLMYYARFIFKSWPFSVCRQYLAANRICETTNQDSRMLRS